MRVWLVRGTVLLCFALVVWFAGPRAWSVLASGTSGRSLGPEIDLDRVDLGRAPAWLRGNRALSRSVLEELSPSLRTPLRQLDEAGARRLTQVLSGLSWVASARLLPRVEGGFRLRLELRRPVLFVEPIGTAAEQVPPCYVTATGICLYRAPDVDDAGLPRCRLLQGVTPGSLPVYLLGREHPDARVLAAAAVAVEWRDELAPRVEGAPALLEVDASNLDYRAFADRSMSEVRISLARRDGGVARFDYGHPPGQPFPRVAVADKATVLSKVLARHPGLDGIEQGDLRFVNMWENWLRLR